MYLNLTLITILADGQGLVALLLQLSQLPGSLRRVIILRQLSRLLDNRHLVIRHRSLLALVHQDHQVEVHLHQEVPGPVRHQVQVVKEVQVVQGKKI